MRMAAGGRRSQSSARTIVGNTCRPPRAPWRATSAPTPNATLSQAHSEGTSPPSIHGTLPLGSTSRRSRHCWLVSARATLEFALRTPTRCHSRAARCLRLCFGRSSCWGYGLWTQSVAAGLRLSSRPFLSPAGPRRSLSSSCKYQPTQRRWDGPASLPIQDWSSAC